jgi:hypothetical protein
MQEHAAGFCPIRAPVYKHTHITISLCLKLVEVIYLTIAAMIRTTKALSHLGRGAATRRHEKIEFVIKLKYQILA